MQADETHGLESGAEPVPPVDAAASERSPESAEPADEGTPTWFRIVRTLMLLASAIVLVFALPVIAWQSTTLATRRVAVGGAEYEFAVTKRLDVVVHVTGPDGGTERHKLVGDDGREPDGAAEIAVEDAGRTVRVTVGDHEARFEFANDSFVPTAGVARSDRG